jgi:hypothetical protein
VSKCSDIPGIYVHSHVKVNCSAKEITELFLGKTSATESRPLPTVEPKRFAEISYGTCVVASVISRYPTIAPRQDIFWI